MTSAIPLRPQSKGVWLYLTPEKARDFLTRLYRLQRPILRSNIDYFSAQLTNGTFTQNPQPMVFTRDSKMMDGQHRCMAVIETGISAWVKVEYDVDESVYPSLDGGRPRAAEDRIQLMPDREHNKKAIEIVKAYLAATDRPAAGREFHRIESTFQKFDSCIVQVTNLFAGRKRIGLTRSGAGAALAVYYSKDPIKAAEFAVGLISGTNLEEHSPILMLREFLTLSSKKKNTKETADDYWKSMSAMIAHYQGRTLASLHLASRDMLGNTLVRLAQHRAEVRRRGAATRKANLAAAAAAAAVPAVTESAPAPAPAVGSPWGGRKSPPLIHFQNNDRDAGDVDDIVNRIIGSG